MGGRKNFRWSSFDLKFEARAFFLRVKSDLRAKSVSAIFLEGLTVSREKFRGIMNGMFS